ncbi:DNA polymerase III subunit epsilon [Oleiphilus sp. HI0125]|uniref:3'-5' exonuclease family protein n=2 Tax=Oleiphilus sp. HI0125 TaxID=1822266 RepID=UPI0007C35D46|nr:exonuclease domain-containing protein [Oleiphilus sp. HI0125]KZZ58336.1 DNA polymerase III subunit epsilon [Oleiphilus sp. HI0125]
MQSDLFPTENVQQLSESFPKRMAIIDCETTGGKPQQHRVIEIGLLIVDDGAIVERWQSFINPQRELPPFITKLTGITPNMLVGQPQFSDIANSLYEKLKDRVFVAHNARFDYGFIKTEFERVGIKFSAKTFCSVKFSRALYPQFNRHGIDPIIKRFGFSIENRHRALDDALIIWKLFLKSTELYSTDELASAISPLLKTPSLPPKIKAAQIKALPKAAGVYYFYSEEGSLLYVGKSVNIRARVMSHFSNDYRSSKELLMSTKVAHIDFKRTPSDFGAQILESNEIKALSPLYNRRLRRTRKLYSFQIEQNSKGYKTVLTQQINSKQKPGESAGLFRSARQASKQLEKLADHYFLCYKLLGLEGNPLDNTPCFRRQLHRCFGACEGIESAEDYNARIDVAMNKHQLVLWPFDTPILVEENDVNDDEIKHFHLIDQWQYLGKIESEEELRERGYVPLNAHIGTEIQAHQHENNAENKAHFDLDIYFILLRFLLKSDQLKLNQLRIHKLTKLG